MLAFELSGEHPTLPRAEAAALARVHGSEPLANPHTRVLLTERVEDPEALAARLAMTYHVIEATAQAPLDAEAIAGQADRIALDGERFAVRVSRLSPGIDRALPIEVARALGAVLAERGKVDLDAPEVVVRVLLDEAGAVMGRQLAAVDRSAFEARHVEERAFFSPVSLHPRLARALVNLTRAPAGASVLDPFCGTGGLVLEAALAGLDTVGTDLDARMVEGTRSTLAQFGTSARLHTADVSDVPDLVGPVDAIVTDPPYGRASTTHKEDVHRLYERFFEAAHAMLGPGARAVVVLPRAEDSACAGEGFGLDEVHPWYVHGSLTRHVHVFVRRP